MPLTAADIVLKFNEIGSADLSAYEDILKDFVYQGFNPVKMWTKIVETKDYDGSDIAKIMACCFQKGFGYKKFTDNVASSNAASDIKAILTKYSFVANSKVPDAATLLRVVSSGGIASFRVFKYVEEKKRLNQAVEPSELGLKCPSALGQVFINSIYCDVASGNNLYEAALIVNEFILAATTVKTMPDKIKQRQGITDIASAILKSRPFYKAARNSALRATKEQKTEFTQYLIGQNYKVYNTAASALDASDEVVADLKTIHKAVFTEEFRTSYVAIGALGEYMKNSDQTIFANQFTKMQLPRAG